MTKDYEVQFPDPHPGQQQILDSDARFKVVSGGRRVGKTALGVILCLKTALKGGKTWWVAPSLGNADAGWEKLTMYAQMIPHAKVLLGDRTVEFAGGGSVTIKTASEPYRLRGSGLDGVVIDEAAWLKKESWTQALRPALSDRRGWAVIISTPFGKDNWFYELWEKVPELKGWARFSMPTIMNPAIDQDELDEAATILTPTVFAQEYLGEFVVPGGTVFREEWLHYYEATGDAYILGPNITEKADCWRFVSVDPAASKKTSADFTVIGVWDVTPETDQILVHMERGRYSGPEVNRKLRDVYDEFKPGYFGVEKNGLGLPLVQYAIEDGLPVRPVDAGKDDLEARVIPATIRMAAGKIWFPRGTTYMAEAERELLAFPSSAHDDIVSMISIATIEVAGGLRAFDQSNLVKNDDYELGEDEPELIGEVQSNGLVEVVNFEEDWFSDID